jgi:hypothetical protein
MKELKELRLQVCNLMSDRQVRQYGALTACFFKLRVSMRMSICVGFSQSNTLITLQRLHLLAFSFGTFA